MAKRTLKLEDLVQIHHNTQFIPGVFNYCNRRCERCGFANRCGLRADELRDHALNPHDDWTERVKRSFEQTSQLIRTWCRREGIDLAAIDVDDDSEGFEQELKAREEKREKDPLLRLAARYTHTAMRLLEAFDRARPPAGWPANVSEALETIGWYSIRVSSKAQRAVSGFEDHEADAALNVDRLQNDWNGSAKVLRLEIAESRYAWTVLLAAGAAPADSPLRQLIATLDDLDACVAERFPDAMAFVRPGFDDGGRVTRTVEDGTDQADSRV